MSIEAGGKIYRCESSVCGGKMFNFGFFRIFFKRKYFKIICILRKTGRLDQRAEEERRRIIKQMSRPLNNIPRYSGNIKGKGLI